MFLLFFLIQIILVCNCVNADAIERMQTNLNMELSDVIMIGVSCGIIVICAFDARIALMIAFLLYASIFILFTLITEEGIAGFNPYYSGLAMMICLVILCLSLLITHKKVTTPYSVI